MKRRAPDGTPENLLDKSKLAEFDYLLRDDGRRAAVTETFWLGGQAKVNQIDWSYDAWGWLIDEDCTSYDDIQDQTQHFVRDLAGNRLEMTTDKGNNGSVAHDYPANPACCAMRSVGLGRRLEIDERCSTDWRNLRPCNHLRLVDTIRHRRFSCSTHR